MRMLRGVSSVWALGVLLAGAVGCGGGEAGVPDGGPGDAGCVENDEPDALGTDSNCDGVDGVLADIVFVDGIDGDDDDVGSREAPVATIGRGIERAIEQEKHHVLVSTALYVEEVTVAEGVSIHGGYSASAGWTRGDLANIDTTITALSSPVVQADGIVATTRMTGLRVSAPAATTYGGSSIAVRLGTSTGVAFEDAEIVAGAGAEGQDRLKPGPGNPGNPGSPGGAASCYNPGGTGGCTSNTSVEVETVAGASRACGCGAGGAGAGSNLIYVGEGQGGERYEGDGTTCSRADVGLDPSEGGDNTSETTGLTGRNGAQGAPGMAGIAGSFNEAFTPDGYVPTSGGSGASGSPGGGGGGGASGYHYECADGETIVMGSGGGAGGAGGCGGAGGEGGGGGGASVAIYAWDSTVTLTRVVLETADGGDGGDGAEGGDGGEGGTPGAGGTRASCPGSPTLGYRGGSGGMGGNGGQGGNGGGGAGGPSIAIVLGGSSTFSAASSNNFAQVANGGLFGGSEGAAGLACSRYSVGDMVCSSF